MLVQITVKIDGGEVGTVERQGLCQVGLGKCGRGE